MACEGDAAVAKGVSMLSAQLEEPDALVRTASLEHLITRAGQENPLAVWADAFCRRYLDLTPTNRR